MFCFVQHSKVLAWNFYTDLDFREVHFKHQHFFFVPMFFIEFYNTTIVPITSVIYVLINENFIFRFLIFGFS